MLHSSNGPNGRVRLTNFSGKQAGLGGTPEGNKEKYNIGMNRSASLY